MALGIGQRSTLEAPVPSVKPRVDLALEQLSEQLDLLYSRIDALETRLDSVLESQPPMAACDPKPPAYNIKKADRIVVLTSSMAAANERLASIIERLEV